MWDHCPRLCPTTMGGVQRYRSEICAELAGAYAESAGSREPALVEGFGIPDANMGNMP